MEPSGHEIEDSVGPVNLLRNGLDEPKIRRTPARGLPLRALQHVGIGIDRDNHHILDMTFDEDRSRIRTGHGPANATLLRRFAIGLIKTHSDNVAETTCRLARKPRRVLDMLKLTGNTRPRMAFS